MSGTQNVSAVRSSTGADAVAEPRVRRPPPPGQPDDFETALPGEDVELRGEQRPVAEPVQQDGVARARVQLLGQRPQRGDADARRR